QARDRYATAVRESVTVVGAVPELELLHECLRVPADVLRSGRARLLAPSGDLALERLEQRALRRYVLVLAAGHIVKVSEAVRLTDRWRGVAPLRSPSRREHEQQRRAFRLGVAAADSMG